MNWSTLSELRAQVKKLWDKGILLRELAGEDTLFPLRLRLKKPTSTELSVHFAEVRDWIAQLQETAQLYRIEWRSIQHRIHGQNELPSEVWIDTLDNALSMIGKKRDAQCFLELLELTEQQNVELRPWLTKRPLQSLELVDEWEQLLRIVAWVQEHPRPGIYLRQVDLPGVHSKLIESRRAVLAELLDLVLKPDAIDEAYSGLRGFCKRYGFLDKPRMVRFRMLDKSQSLLPTNADQDFSVPQEVFAKLDLPVDRVFITENEINFLAFPPVPRSMVVFGAGYGFESLAAAEWVSLRQLYYWGDLDTHGFAILDQLRKNFPEARSFLMDRDTMMNHKVFWGSEVRPEARDLLRLTSEESTLYDELRKDVHGSNLRLEQERIGYIWLLNFLDSIRNE